MIDAGTATMVAATMTAAAFGATVPNAATAAREGWTPREVQRAALTAGVVSIAAAAIAAAASGSGEPLYVTVVLGLGLGLVYQLSAGAGRAGL